VNTVKSVPRFIYNGGYRNFHQELTTNLEQCDAFDMSVAFIRYSGLQLLLDTFNEMDRCNIKGRILTSTYLNSTEPKALEKLRSFPNIETRVFVPSQDRGFHSKGYLFRKGDQYSTIIGSANITQSALKSNVEWNVYNEAGFSADFAAEVQHEFDTQWADEHTKQLTETFLQEYANYLKRLDKQSPRETRFIFEETKYGHPQTQNDLKISPNRMQTEAIIKLDRLRKHKENRALAIAATGTGKTYMAVFDSLQFRPKRLLFVVHREDILLKAKESFHTIIDPERFSIGLFTGNQKDTAVDYLFATIQTMQNHFQDFPRDTFDYIVIDEAHHASSPSYQRILHWFTPRFLLGLTATPERSDAGDIYSLFGNNVAIEIRLRQALDWELVSPFHYFGITEFQGIDYANVDIEDTAAVARLLMVGSRVDYILEKMNFYGHDGRKRKALGFCADINHAKFMSIEFNRRGIPAIALTGEDEVSKRMATMLQLEKDTDPLEIIFTVDIFNEGIDIPSINTVLMLRPTESAIIFIQQLGRGLRKTLDKEFVTVLDFIGNHRKSFLMAVALMGSRHFDRDDLKVAVKSDFSDIPGCSHIRMDRIAKEQILKQLEQEKFFSLKYLRQEYFDFKRINSNRIPALVDFLKVDSAVDPVKFSTYAGTWLEFVARMEPDSEASQLVSQKELIRFLRFFTDILPSKRVYDQVIAEATMRLGSLTPEYAYDELTKYLTNPKIETIEHSFQFLSKKYMDSAERKNHQDLLFRLDGKVLIPESGTAALYQNKSIQTWMTDLLQYSILRYELEFGAVDWGLPHLKLWEQYAMRDIAIISNATRTHSSFRGQGLITDNGRMYIFVDLHKEVDVKESINYQDRFLSRTQFQWESPNNTSVQTKQGQRLINHRDLRQDIHLFARKFREIEGVTQPFTYFGTVLYQTHDPEKNNPMRIFFVLEHEVPEKLFYELTTRVD